MGKMAGGREEEQHLEENEKTSVRVGVGIGVGVGWFVRDGEE